MRFHIWERRLFSQVEVSRVKFHNGTPCLEWTGHTIPRGKVRYGSVYFEGRQQKVHRVFWKLWVGPVEDKLDLDHLCRNTICVSPTHLEPVSRAENLRRGRVARYTGYCPHGHSRITYGTRDKSGQVYCRECKRLKWHEWKSRQ